MHILIVHKAHLHAKHTKARGSGGMPPRKVWKFVPSKIEHFDSPNTDDDKTSASS